MNYQVIFILLFEIYITSSIFGKKPDAEISPSAFIKTPGSIVEVKCQLTSTRHSVFDLKLIKVKDKEQTILNSTIMDNTTIRASYGPIDLTDNGSYVYCRAKTSTLARKLLLVDVPPTAPTKMDCISYHLITMECTFIPFTIGNIITDWIIQYTNSGFGGIYTTCHSPRPAECILGSSEDNLANPFYPMLDHTFRVNVTNFLGSSVAHFKVNPWEVVKPDPVRELGAEIVNSTCMKVTWSYSSFPTLPFPLRYHIMVEPGLQDIRKVVTNQEHTILCDLSPNTEVKVTVNCETTLGGYPSDNLMITAQLPEDKPKPPIVPTGAFSARDMSNTTREISLYWQDIPSQFRHGTITQLRASVYNDTSRLPIFTQAIASASRTAVISPGLMKDANYSILIQAKTSEGYSDIVQTAIVNVSDEQSVTSRPAWVDSELGGQGVYTVYWSAETDHSSIVRIYWCYGRSNSDGQVICLTSIQMEPSSPNSSEHTLQVAEGSIKERCDTCTWNFGVSMETDGATSGIVWNVCRYRRHREPRLGDVILSNVTASSVTVTWHHNCWLVTQFGRPAYYELGVLDSETDDHLKCSEIKAPIKVQANHGEIVETLKARPKTSLCIRAVGRDKTGMWLIRPIILHGADHSLSTEVVAGMSVSLVLFGVVLLLLIVRLCFRKKWFDKIYIEVPRATKSYLNEEEISKPSFVKMKDNPLYVRTDLRASGSSATKETIVSCSTPSPKIMKEQNGLDAEKLLIFLEDPKPKDQSDKGSKEIVSGDLCSTLYTDVDIEYPCRKVPKETIENTQESKDVVDNSHEQGSVSGSESMECANKSTKCSTNGSMVAFSGSFEEDCSDREDSLSYVQAGCNPATLQELEVLLEKGQGRSKGDNSRQSEKEAVLKSSKYSQPSIDGSNYLQLKHSTNPHTGCNYYHHENTNLESGNDLLASNCVIFDIGN